VSVGLRDACFLATLCVDALMPIMCVCGCVCARGLWCCAGCPSQGSVFAACRKVLATAGALFGFGQSSLFGGGGPKAVGRPEAQAGDEEEAEDEEVRSRVHVCVCTRAHTVSVERACLRPLFDGGLVCVCVYVCVCVCVCVCSVWCLQSPTAAWASCCVLPACGVHPCCLCASRTLVPVAVAVPVCPFHPRACAYPYTCAYSWFVCACV
jgi:hypothetical protein